jgi:hypothetical protein
MKWLVREKLLAGRDWSHANQIQLELSAVQRFCRELIRDHDEDLDDLTRDCLVSELVKEFFTHRPLIKGTVLRHPSTHS